MPARIAYVIPALNEETSLEPTLQSVFAQAGEKEVVVSDGGSADRTREVAASFGCRIVQGAPGRGPQMNRGARDCDADILMFLHADTVLPSDASRAITQILDDRSVVAGSFRLSFREKRPSLDFYAKCSAINHPLLTYGDQGLFLRRPTFEAIGEFKPYPFFEDVEIQSRLRRQGRFKKSSLAVTTSSRRFQRRGPIAQQFVNIALVSAYYAGISPNALARFYRHIR